MIKNIIEYLNCQLSSLNLFEKQFSLCERITKGDKIFPAEYKSKGEYVQINNFDKYNGVSYFRKNGDISISDETNTTTSCGILKKISIPLLLICVIPRKKIEVDNNYTEDYIANKVLKSIITKSGILKQSLKARNIDINVDAYSTDSIKIIDQEYSNIQKADINHKFIYISSEISVSIIIDKKCINDCCENEYGYCCN